MLSSQELWLLIIATVLVSAAGYVYNDLIDLPIDQINRPHKVIVGEHYSIRFTRVLTWVLWLVGLVVSTYLAWLKQELEWLWLYPVFGGLLILYPSQLKTRPLAGNLFIAACCAGTAGLVWLAERFAWAQLPVEDATSLAFIISLFMVYAFLATWIRELVKDLEDLPGDQTIGRRTFPAQYGTSAARKLVQVLSLLLGGCLLLAIWQPFTTEWSWAISLGGTFLLLGILYLFRLFSDANSIEAYRQLSRYWKFFLLGGLMLMLIYGL